MLKRCLTLVMVLATVVTLLLSVINADGSKTVTTNGIKATKSVSWTNEDKIKE